MDKTRTNSGFSHEKLDAYKVSIEFARWANTATRRMPRGHYDLRNQLIRAAASVSLNLAEGASQRSAEMARKHYRIAQTSAAECAASLDLLDAFGLAKVTEGRQLVGRIGAMVSKLAS